ncbi:flagella synthesis protein FlgN [Nitrincola tapanii]|uniref:Flagellar protein FlgN n=1 Tax=Nitrincola tapanii TaxID=1708751 RepID=A0A5A9W8S7_9GAMM|nr:flagellar protein FlgN [Nitrincola tapanii]KAA0876575.1 flagellar protein FlgN [Nitrincola tapanii]
MSSDLLPTFFTLVRQGSALFAELLAQLESERQALESRDLDQLTQTTEAKKQLLLKIERNVLERNQTLTLLGFTPAREGVEALTQQLPPQQAIELQQDWTELALNLEQVQTANQRNEQILSRSKQSIDQLISLLQGQHKANVIYDPQGSKGNYEAQRSLGKA